PLILVEKRGQPWLYPQRLLALEGRLSASLAQRLGAQNVAAAQRPFDPTIVARVVAEVAERPVKLSAEQHGAVLSALSGQLRVISGGPGTGKTSIVFSM